MQAHELTETELSAVAGGDVSEDQMQSMLDQLRAAIGAPTQ